MTNGDLPVPFKLFNELFETPSLFAPPLDVIEDPEGFTLTMELPGLSSKDVSVECENGVMVVRGEKKWDLPQSAEALRTERTYGSFERRITLSDNVDDAKIGASMKDGVLSIRAPKKPEALPRKVQIEIK